MVEEFAGVGFNEARLEKRLAKTMETLSRQPDKSIWASSGNRAGAKAIYNMAGNEKFDRNEILRAHREGIIKQMVDEPVILAVQDTTGVNYNGRRKMEGNGYISASTMGVNIHRCLAVTPGGLVLGAREQQKNRPIEKKEGNRQLETMERVSESIPSETKVIHVCDREGDMAD
jgi:hypothetical protein